MPAPDPELPTLLRQAAERRDALRARLQREGTDAYRLFHGVAEGRPGLTVDRYGDLLLVQTFREALAPEELETVVAISCEVFPAIEAWVWNHRGEGVHEGACSDLEGAELERVVSEGRMRFALRGRHRGQDPWLFLDLRVGRRWVREHARGASVLNLFAYTGGLGVAAAVGGARELWQVDFSQGALAVAERNHALNPSPCAVRLLASDCIPVLRQLAGQRIQRARSKARYPRVERRRFDLVLLDPPRVSKGPFGAVDVVGDYPSLIKPALLALEEGGRLLATNHVAAVSSASFVAMLERTAEKAGRPWAGIDVLGPEEDFPSFDGAPPLKVALCSLPAPEGAGS